MAANYEYFTINPDTLDDPELWAYADIQGLCKSLKISAKGKRESLIQRLQIWHRKNRSNMQIKSGNFCRMGVRIYSPSRPSECKVAAEFLSPLTRRNRLRNDGTPRKSCLKTPNKRRTARKLNFGFPECDKEDTPPTRKSANIMFSPYNKVKLIPGRFSKDYGTPHGPRGLRS